MEEWLDEALFNNEKKNYIIIKENSKNFLKTSCKSSLAYT